MGHARKTQKRPTPTNTAEPVSKAPSAKQARRQTAIDAARAKKKELLLVAGVSAIAFIAFFNSLNGEFVYDDRFQVLQNPTLTELSNVPKMFTQSVWQFLNSSSDSPVGLYYRPIFNIALILNYQLFGFGVFGWHLVSVLLHVFVTYLVYKLARQWQTPSEVALAAALLFGVHPVHSESIAWVSGLPDPLAAAFILGSLILYERHYRGAGPRSRFLEISIGLAFLAMLSKEVSVAFPVFLAVRELFERTEGESMGETLSRATKRTAPYLAVTAIYFALRYAVLGFLSKSEPKATGISTFEVLLTIPSVLLKYVQMMFVPYPLAITYDHPYVSSPSDPRFWASALILAAILIATLWLVRRSPVGRGALAFAVLFLMPVLNLKTFNHQESLIHDRYLYLPSIGFCLLISLALAWVAARFSKRKELFQSAVVLIGLVFFGLTINQNSTWQNDLVLVDSALQTNPQSPFLLNYKGAHFSRNKRFTEAEQFYQEALKYSPAYYDTHSNLGDVYQQQGRMVEAEGYYARAVEYGSPYFNTYYNLGVVRTSQGKLAEAEGALLRAIEIRADSADALYNLGWIYDRQTRNEAAEQMYKRALQVKPAYPEPRINLGLVLTRLRRYDEALQQLQTAQTYAPDHPIMLYALGDVYLQLNRYQEAVSAFARLEQREPRNLRVHTGLGLCYEAMGNKDQAIRSFQRAIEVAPQEQYTNVAREHLAKLQTST